MKEEERSLLCFNLYEEMGKLEHLNMCNVGVQLTRQSLKVMPWVILKIAVSHYDLKILNVVIKFY